LEKIHEENSSNNGLSQNDSPARKSSIASIEKSQKNIFENDSFLDNSSSRQF
jgi:hypothetical protein